MGERRARHYQRVVENKGGRLDHLGNPPDMSKYLKKTFACGADFWMVENKGGGKAANSADAFFIVTMHFALKSADQKCHIPISDPKNMFFTYEFSSERPKFSIICFLMDIFPCNFWFLIQ